MGVVTFSLFALFFSIAAKDERRRFAVRPRRRLTGTPAWKGSRPPSSHSTWMMTAGAPVGNLEPWHAVSAGQARFPSSGCW